jgi:hypothetical protein
MTSQLPVKIPAGFDPMAAVQQIVALGSEWALVHEQEVTKRAQIGESTKVAIEQIRERKELFLTYLDRSFDERSKNFDELFRSLDLAIESNADLVPHILASISALAHKSPFADLHDPQLVRQMLDDPDHEWTV